MLGSLLGFILPKLALGALVVTGSGEDWWLERSDTPAETTLGPEEEKKLALENELACGDPFAFDMVENEWRNYLKKTKTGDL